MSVLGISSKLRTHSRDFTWRPTLKDMSTKVNKSRVNLEEGELLLCEGPDGAGDEGALGEAAVELGEEGLVPGHLPSAQEPLVPGQLLHQVPLLLCLLILGHCQSLGTLEHLKNDDDKKITQTQRRRKPRSRFKKDWPKDLQVLRSCSTSQVRLSTTSNSHIGLTFCHIFPVA